MFQKPYCVKGWFIIINRNNDQALSKFKQVANDYPGSPEAIQSVATARLIYIDLGRVNEYAAWVKTLRLCGSF